MADLEFPDRLEQFRKAKKLARQELADQPLLPAAYAWSAFCFSRKRPPGGAYPLSGPGVVLPPVPPLPDGGTAHLPPAEPEHLLCRISSIACLPLPSPQRADAPRRRGADPGLSASLPRQDKFVEYYICVTFELFLFTVSAKVSILEVVCNTGT